jgi:micrococcal nuclease
MNKILLAFTLLLLSVPVYAKEPIKVFDCMTERVIDGDTLVCMIKNGGGASAKVRLYGIDAPEGDKKHYKTGKLMKPGQPYGNEATTALTSKVSQSILTVEVIDIDRYKRMVSLVIKDGRNINKEMVAEGHAWSYKQYLKAPYRSEFIGVEEQARAKKLGLWKDANPEPPWEYRKRMKIAGEVE